MMLFPLKMNFFSKLPIRITHLVTTRAHRISIVCKHFDVNLAHLYVLIVTVNVSSYVSTQTQQCYDQVHLGPQEDGGWEVCVYGSLNLQPPCLIYSFGYADAF
jgi:hypothetical protein